MCAINKMGLKPGRKLRSTQGLAPSVTCASPAGAKGTLSCSLSTGEKGSSLLPNCHPQMKLPSSPSLSSVLKEFSASLMWEKKKVVTVAKETGLMGSPVIQKEIKRLKRLEVNENNVFICFNQFKLDQEFRR